MGALSPKSNYLNSKKARNAGFFRRDQNIYRVNQVQARAQYGYAFEVNQIIEITPNQYSETCIKRVEPEPKTSMACIIITLMAITTSLTTLS